MTLRNRAWGCAEQAAPLGRDGSQRRSLACPTRGTRHALFPASHPRCIGRSADDVALCNACPCTGPAPGPTASPGSGSSAARGTGHRRRHPWTRSRHAGQPPDDHDHGYQTGGGSAPGADQRHGYWRSAVARRKHHRSEEADCQQPGHRCAGQQRAFCRLRDRARPEHLVGQRQQRRVVRAQHAVVLPRRHPAAQHRLPHQRHLPRRNAARPARHAVWRRLVGRHHPLHHQPAGVRQCRRAGVDELLPDRVRRPVQRHRWCREPAHWRELRAAHRSSPARRKGLHRPLRGHTKLPDFGVDAQARCEPGPLQGRRLPEGKYRPHLGTLAPDERSGVDAGARHAITAGAWHQRRAAVAGQRRPGALSGAAGLQRPHRAVALP